MACRSIEELKLVEGWLGPRAMFRELESWLMRASGTRTFCFRSERYGLHLRG